MTTLHEDASPQPGHPGDPDDSFFGALDDLGEPSGPDLRTFDRHRVTAVLVSHDGMRWLPYALTAVLALARSPQRVIAVDTGSTDGSLELLREELGAASVLELPADTGFGAAVRHAVDALKGAPALPAHAGDEGPQVEWLWLLHDDCAPDPETLRRLLAAVDGSPSVGVVGPKVRGWHDSSRLLEVGVSISGSGRRETGLERGELDQGQHDGRSDVLAVGTAGMLVRHDVWDELDGFDPGLPLFRDDVDLGWRANLAGHRVVVTPDAVVHHVEAGGHGRRPSLPAVRGSVHRADRRAAVRVLLANAPAPTVPFQWLRLLGGTLLRAFALLLGKAPKEAWDELAGASSVLFAPVRLAHARSARRGLRRVPSRSLRHLRPTWGSGLRHGTEAVLGLASGRTDLAASGGSALDSGPTGEDTETLVVGPSRLRLALARPGVQLTLVLALVSLVAFRGLLFGDGTLQGGALLPAGDGASSLWSAYTAGWHDVGVGSPTAAPPYLVPLALAATLLLGKAWLAVDLVLLLAVPLAGLVGYLLLVRAGAHRLPAVAGAVTYALLPAVTGAVAAGRLGTAVAGWLLPLALWVGGGALGLGRQGSLRRAWVAGLLLAVVVAFVPVTWLLAVVAGVAAVALTGPRSTAAWLRLVAVLVVPPLVLLPWTLHLLSDRSWLLLEAGAPSASLADPSLPSWHVVVASPGGPGLPAAWVTLPLLVAALAALLRSDRRRAVALAWTVALTGLVVGVLLAGRTVRPPSLGTLVPVWPGPATLLVGAGLVAAAVLGASGARGRIAGYRFGWRQPLAGLVAAVALLVPLVLGAGWMQRGASQVLTRSGQDVLPAYVEASTAVPARPRSLVLQAQQSGVVAYALVPAEGRRIGDAEVAPPAAQTRQVAAVVARLLAGTADVPEVAVLASFATAYVVVDAPVDPLVERRLDGTPGLTRVSAVDGGAVWRLLAPGSRVAVVRPPLPPVQVDADPHDPVTTVDTLLPPATSGELRLAESADPGWRATAGGVTLAGHTSDHWAQGFDFPSDAIHVTVDHVDHRFGWLVAEGIVTAAVVVLALPGRRRTDDEPDSDEPAPAVVAAAAPPAPAPPANPAAEVAP